MKVKQKNTKIVVEDASQVNIKVAIKTKKEKSCQGCCSGYNAK
ncbi:hypothetical protein BPUTSESOX_1913 [uncultured Gammaproteobacteria bacterium]|jgi:hypothetical protein|nr:hypothetical protein [uncultured Gammaproteobacteria bacterium]VVH51107.1 hypothetical protein BPUTSESOX_1913 [uncultured Gammaproteobacteria bacterium]